MSLLLVIRFICFSFNVLVIYLFYVQLGQWPCLTEGAMKQTERKQPQRDVSVHNAYCLGLSPPTVYRILQVFLLQKHSSLFHGNLASWDGFRI